ncbi:MAG: ABC transporter substrate-binding protein [Pontimonas sp.]|nr:ABC transporter substrate-binding protein [Pontimonas sp.]MDP4816519.1 ABC transporter substrate-binding protein [Pontimonas sp.]
MRHFVRRRSMVGIATLSVAALALAGCAAAEDSGETTTDAGSDSGASVAAGCEAYADYLGNEGETVEIYTTIVEPESTLFQESFVDFEECTGITIEWNGDQAFEEQIAVRVAGGTAPDLAIFPQPGLLSSFSADLVPASDALVASVDANYTADWKNYGSVDGTLYAAPLGANVKSFVWYSPKTFADNGWAIPTTWAEMITLSDEIAASDFDGYAWCAGIESGAATGWLATDWMEDLMLRFQDGETYDTWVDHSMPFNDPKVLEVLEAAGSVLKNEDYVGNVSAIATTTFQAGGAGVVDGTCAMHRQASFLGGILVGDYGATIVTPEDTDVEGGISTFYFPGLSADDSPALGGGEFVASFNDAPAVEAVQVYLSSADWNNKKAALGGWFSPHLGLDTTNVADPVNKVAVEILQNATTFRFDASDLMPGAVGAGSFWTEMTAWIAEDKADQAVLDAIEATWPAS